MAGGVAANAALRTGVVVAATGVAGAIRTGRFVDATRVKFVGGNGAPGCISFMHLFSNNMAGPDGGNGGNGGHIVLRASRVVKSLNHVKSLYIGLAGVRGEGKNMYGKDGEHTFVDVPIGTTVRPARPKTVADVDYDPDASDLIADLDEHGSLFIAARGGAGGRGNMSFLSNANRHPRQAQAGGVGESNAYELRMRLYAHIGLIGMPNVGKSTMLRTLTNANVRVGEYAFTTKYPQVGTIEYEDYTQVAISDLPGLIEDSHKNRGLGVQFLRHVERCACIVYIIDLSCDSPQAQLEQLISELDGYKPGLSKRPNFVVANKIDTLRGQQNADAFASYVTRKWPSTKLLTVSTLTGENLADVRLEFKRMHDAYIARNAGDSDALVW